MNARKLRITGSAEACFRITLLLLWGLVIIGCAREEIAADLEAPPAPEFVPRSADTALVEQGIDTVPEGYYISLSWLPPEASDLAGYRLYRQAEDYVDSLPPEMIEELPLPELGNTSMPDYLDNSSVLFSDSSAGFFYWVKAYDQSGNESGLSEEAYYKLLPKPISLSYSAFNDSLELTWDYTEALSQVNYFVVRLFEAGNDTAFWLQPFSQFSDFKVTYYDNLANGIYRFQVDVVGLPPLERPSGSEAALQFSIP